MSRLSVRFSDAICKIAVHKNITLVAWHEAPELVQVRAFIEASRTSERTFPRDGALWHAIIGGTPRFAEGVREQLVRHTQTTRSFPLGSAHLILRSGLTGAAARAFLSTILLVGRAPFPNKVFGEAPMAATWLSAQLAATKESPRRENLLSLHDELCAL